MSGPPVGNFYSLEGDHDKAVAYFRRAVRLSRHDQSAWILLGHEYLELKNCTMAIEAYNRGLGVPMGGGGVVVCGNPYGIWASMVYGSMVWCMGLWIS